MMGGNGARERAAQPEDLGRFFVERANAGDAEGLAALYETDAVLAFPPGQVTAGVQAIRQVYEQLLAGKPTVTAGAQRPALRINDAHTVVPASDTSECARSAARERSA